MHEEGMRKKDANKLLRFGDKTVCASTLIFVLSNGGQQ